MDSVNLNDDGHSTDEQIDMETGKPLSEVFQSLADTVTEPVSLGHIEEALSDRSFAAILTFFALLNLLPLPPGTGIVTGIPLVIISLQMARGRETPWLPAFVRNHSITPERFRSISLKAVPRLQKLERLIKPRYWPFRGRQAERWLGAFTFILGMAVVLPMPLSNWLPAFSSALIGIALSERDGALMIGGVIVGIISLIIIIGLAVSLAFSADAIISHISFLK